MKHECPVVSFVVRHISSNLCRPFLLAWWSTTPIRLMRSFTILTCNFAMLWLSLTLKTVPWKFGPLGGRVKLTPFTRPKVQQLTNMLAWMKPLLSACSWSHHELYPLASFHTSQPASQHQQLWAPYSSVLRSGRCSECILSLLEIGRHWKTCWLHAFWRDQKHHNVVHLLFLKVCFIVRWLHGFNLNLISVALLHQPWCYIDANMRGAI